MQADQRSAGQGPAPARSPDGAEVATLRAACRQQASALETLTRVIANLRRGARALKAENAELRAARIVVRQVLAERVAASVLEVEDPGRDGVVAQHTANQTAGGGFGLRIVQSLGEGWGFERAARGGTRVWAHLSDTPSPAGPDCGEHGEATLRPASFASAPRGEATRPRRRERLAGPGLTHDGASAALTPVAP